MLSYIVLLIYINNWF